VCVLGNKGVVKPLSSLAAVCGVQQSTKVLSDLFRALQLSCPQHAAQYHRDIARKWFYHISRHTKEESTTKVALCNVLCAYTQEKKEDEILASEILSIVETNCLNDGKSFDANHGLAEHETIVFHEMFVDVSQKSVAATLGMDVQHLESIHRIYLNSFKRACFPFIGKTHFPVHALFSLLEFNHNKRGQLYSKLMKDSLFKGTILKPSRQDPDGITKDREDKKLTDRCGVFMPYYKLQAGHTYWCLNTRFWQLCLYVLSYIEPTAYWANLVQTLTRSMTHQFNNNVLTVEQQMQDLQDFMVTDGCDDLSVHFDMHMNSHGDEIWATEYFDLCLSSTAWMLNEFCLKQTEFNDYGRCVNTCAKPAAWAGYCWIHSREHVMSRNYLPAWWIYQMQNNYELHGVEEKEKKKLKDMLTKSVAAEALVKQKKASLKKAGLREAAIVQANKAKKGKVCNRECASCVCMKSDDFDFYIPEGGTIPKGVIYPPRPTSQQLLAHSELRKYVLANVKYGSETGPEVAQFLKRATGDKNTVRIAYEKKCLYCGEINWWLKMDKCGGEKCDNYTHKYCSMSQGTNIFEPESSVAGNNKTTTKLLLCRDCMHKAAEDEEEGEEETEEEGKQEGGG
jgi:hypothetical protein